jgi:hypothetical protein
MVIRIPSRLRIIIIPSRIIEGRLIIEKDTTLPEPIPVLLKIRALFSVVFFILVLSWSKDRI